MRATTARNVGLFNGKNLKITNDFYIQLVNLSATIDQILEQQRPSKFNISELGLAGVGGGDGAATDFDALIYVLVVLLAYAAAIGAMVLFNQRERRSETKYREYYEDYVLRQNFMYEYLKTKYHDNAVKQIVDRTTTKKAALEEVSCTSISPRETSEIYSGAGGGGGGVKTPLLRLTTYEDFDGSLRPVKKSPSYIEALALSAHQVAVGSIGESPTKQNRISNSPKKQLEQQLDEEEETSETSFYP